jgi:hypothetical protein
MALPSKDIVPYYPEQENAILTFLVKLHTYVDY